MGRIGRNRKDFLGFPVCSRMDSGNCMDLGGFLDFLGCGNYNCFVGFHYCSRKDLARVRCLVFGDYSN